jgi:hypothetical protein
MDVVDEFGDIFSFFCFLSKSVGLGAICGGNDISGVVVAQTMVYRLTMGSWMGQEDPGEDVV